MNLDVITDMTILQKSDPDPYISKKPDPYFILESIRGPFNHERGFQPDCQFQSYTDCTGSLDSSYIVSYLINSVKTSWASK